MFRQLILALSILLLLSLAGCVISPRRDGTNNGGGGKGTGQLYVVNQSNNAILRFGGATAANGNISPNAILSGSATLLATPSYIFIDTANNRLYVANTGASDVLIFENASTLSGNVNGAPSRAISSTNLTAPVDVAVDATRDLLYVADNFEVAVFQHASTANGSTVVFHVLQLTFTPGAILLDAANDRLFVADPTTSSVDVFDTASTLNGTVTAPRVITGAQTQLSQPDGLRIDGAGRLIVSNFSPASITIYNNAATNSGPASPVAVLTGSNTTLAGPTQLALDPTTNSGELYVADPSGANVAVFSSITTVTGSINPSPNRNITGANTTLNNTAVSTARGVAIDTTR